jgi:L-rhamnose mutarotase
MTQVLVRYKIKPEHAAENERLVRAVYDELQRTEPGGFHYATFQLDDGVTFVHLASTDSDDGQNPLSELEAFRQFQENISDRCDEAPVVIQLREIGSYHLFGGQGKS